MSNIENKNSERTKTKFHFGRNPLSLIIVVGTVVALFLIISTIVGASKFSKNKATAFVTGEPNTTYNSTEYADKIFTDIEYISSETDLFSYTFTCTDWDTESNTEYDLVDFQLKVTWKDSANMPYLTVTNLETSLLAEVCVLSNVGSYTAYSSLTKQKVNMNVNSGLVTFKFTDMKIEKFPKSTFEFPFFYKKELPTVYVDIFFFTDQAQTEYKNYGLKYAYKDLGITSGGIKA